MEDLERIRFDPLFHNRYGDYRRLCVLHIGAIMSAILLSMISVVVMTISFGIMLYLVGRKRFKGFDGFVLVIVFTMFLTTAASSTMLGAYGFNTIRSGGSNAGLSLSRD